MTKHYCDACGKEIAGSNVYIDIPYHFLAESLLAYMDKLNYRDEDGNTISGRRERADLCIGCSNRIYGKAVQELKKIKEEY